MSRFLKRIVPALAGKRPLITLNRVVFPAPLGPITLVILPSSISRSIRERTSRAPKHLSTPRSSRMAMFFPPSYPRADFLGESHDPAWAEQNKAGKNPAKNHHPRFGQPTGENISENDDQTRPDHRSNQGAHPTQQGP